MDLSMRVRFHRSIVTGPPTDSDHGNTADEQAVRSGRRVRLGDWRSPVVAAAWLVSLAMIAAAVALLVVIL